MADKMRLSELVGQIEDSITSDFGYEYYWISAQICNVKKQESTRRCWLSLEEYDRGRKVTEVKAVFWSSYYDQIAMFEKVTGQAFKDGIEINCKVKVTFHQVYGLKLDIIEIDAAHTLGTLEIERQQTLDRLAKENPQTIKLVDGTYFTYNNQLGLPQVISRIALITAPNSDGQRDFIQEITHNKHQYSFTIREYLTTIQGDNAHQLILEQLGLIAADRDGFDVVAIVRGGGSMTDFKPFDDYELCRMVAGFPIPIYCGIGHDRNQSIIDLMARQYKTPTKVAAHIVDNNFDFEEGLISLKETFFHLVQEQIREATQQLSHARRIVKLASPQAILDRGFAIIMRQGLLTTDPAAIGAGDEVQIILRDEIIDTQVIKKSNNDRGLDI